MSTNAKPSKHIGVHLSRSPCAPHPCLVSPVYISMLRQPARGREKASEYHAAHCMVMRLNLPSLTCARGGGGGGGSRCGTCPCSQLLQENLGMLIELLIELHCLLSVDIFLRKQVGKSWVWLGSRLDAACAAARAATDGTSSTPPDHHDCQVCPFA